MNELYLDAAATTKPKTEVVHAMQPYLNLMYYNPSSLYRPAQIIKEAIEKSRKIVADYIGCKSNEVYFTSGGSESNCWAIQGFVQNRINKGRTPSIITTTIEHHSILACVEGIGVDAHYIPVDKEGFINLEILESVLQYVAAQTDDGEDILVSVQFANNEIGTIQHIKDIAKIVHNYGAIFHTDAVQAFGQYDIDVEQLNIDMLSASGHKIGTPKGIGILYKKDSIQINPIIYGSQENNMRGGTENVPYIIGFGKAVEILQKAHTLRNRISMNLLKSDLITKLRAEGCIINGSLTERLPNNINITFPNKATGEALIYMMDASGIYISAGSACNSHSQSVSHVLKAIGLTEDEALRTIRITLPEGLLYLKSEERENVVDKFISEFKKQLKILDISN